MKTTLLFGFAGLAVSAPVTSVSDLLSGILPSPPTYSQPSSGPWPSPSSNSNDNSLLRQMSAKYYRNTALLLGRNDSKCTPDKLGVRRSWTSLSKKERTEYLQAVKCLHSKPARSNPTDVPGARNRMDDFTASHMNQTNLIHVDGLLLPWHRQFTWSYEQALRNECGYKGFQPYWEFSEYADDQSKSPIFDGTPTSFGGNGEYVPHNGTVGTIPGLPTPIPLIRPAGTGGGCVKNGGLVDGNGTFIVNLGPVAPANNAPDNTWGLQYNPRCLKRDFYTPLSSYNLSWAMTNTLMRSEDIHSFRPFIDREIHPAAHQWAGGDLYDLFSSPSDPVFYLLHAQIDRLWTIWQGQDYASRGLALDGTTTFINDPPSPNATLDTPMIMHEAGGTIPIKVAMSAIGQGSEYCYIYA